jgi:benzoyl-CoA reductase/2-hydroxyglutaryl-CoA dehydratase subunit BcrC/BadD/HgdB
MMDCMCPRHMDTPKMNRRVNTLMKLQRIQSDGIIYQQLQFCDPWAYERMVGSHVSS